MLEHCKNIEAESTQDDAQLAWCLVSTTKHKNNSTVLIQAGHRMQAHPKRNLTRAADLNSILQEALYESSQINAALRYCISCCLCVQQTVLRVVMGAGSNVRVHCLPIKCRCVTNSHVQGVELGLCA